MIGEGGSQQLQQSYCPSLLNMDIVQQGGFGVIRMK